MLVDKFTLKLLDLKVISIKNIENTILPYKYRVGIENVVALKLKNRHYYVKYFIKFDFMYTQL